MNNPEPEPAKGPERMTTEVAPDKAPAVADPVHAVPPPLPGAPSAADLVQTVPSPLPGTESVVPPEGRPDLPAADSVAKAVDLDELHQAVIRLSKGINVIANNNTLWTEIHLNKPQLERLRSDNAALVKKVEDLEAKLRDTDTELQGAVGSVSEGEQKIQKLSSDIAAKQEDIRLLKEAEALASSKIVLLSTELGGIKGALAARDGELKASKEDCRVADVRIRELEVQVSELQKVEKELRELLRNRLAQHIPECLLISGAASQLLEFDAAASRGDAPSQRVLAGLSLLKAGFSAGAGPDDKLIAVRSVGTALHAVWTAQGKDARAISRLFSEWQDYLNAIPGAGFQLVVPDLGQSVPQNVTAPAGVTKVSEVQLWIVKGGNGSIYCKGVVR